MLYQAVLEHANWKGYLYLCRAEISIFAVNGTRVSFFNN